MLSTLTMPFLPYLNSYKKITQILLLFTTVNNRALIFLLLIFLILDVRRKLTANFSFDVIDKDRGELGIELGSYLSIGDFVRDDKNTSNCCYLEIPISSTKKTLIRNQ